LALLLEGRFNVYGIQGKGMLDTGPLPETRQELYDDFIREIKRVQPEGSYMLGGHCYGAIISYELARILEEHNHHVAGLFLFDEPALMTDKIIDHLRILRWYNKFRRTGEILKRVLTDIKLKLSREGRPGLGTMPEDLEARRIEINKNYERLFPDQMHYTRIIKAPIWVFKAAWWAQRPPHPRWKPETIARMSHSNVKLVDTPGGHISMFETPNVESLSKKILEYS
jgi:thioesterase domain-containing protein